MKLSLSRGRLPLAAAAALAAGAVGAGPAMATAGHHHRHRTLYVSPRGHNTGRCTRMHPCRSINFAIGRARKGDTVHVARGTYRGTVTVARDIRVIGFGHPVIDARRHSNGILITGAKSQGAHVTGFLVKNARDEGILALQTSHVLIAGNIVRHNDRGMFAKNKTGECAPQGEVPGDCGEGIHLMSVFDAIVRNNTVQGNSGGILITDEFGPSHDLLISRNKVLHNLYDCGITLAGHNTNAVSSTGQLQPTQGGVYRNVVIDNTANGNGVKGQGGGILIAAGAPGSGVYGNTVEHNTANGNGLGGLTLHSHSPGQYFDNNRILDNTFENDSIAGMPGGKPGDVDTQPNGLSQTAGIVVFSAVTPLKGTVISGNFLAKEYYGIWTEHVPAIKKSANTFDKSVKVDIHQQ